MRRQATPGEQPDELAPDGSEVRRLVRTSSASMAHFTLGAGKVSAAVCHRTIDELWYVVAGEGELWLGETDGGSDADAGIIDLSRGVSVAIARGTPFQMRARTTLEIVGVAVPPWPGDAEAVPVEGPWKPDP